MNILMINWTWYPSGGDWTYIDNLNHLYQKNGHHIIPFSMKNELNISTPYDKYFVENINYKSLNQNINLTDGVRVLAKSIYSAEAIEKISKLLDENTIDLVHLNLIHKYITPAIIKVIKAANIPIIWTLHDYTIICPEGTFLSNGEVCEDCKVGKFYNATFKKCKKGSLMASMVASIDNYTNHYLNFYQYVDYFICPSKFLFDKFKSYGFFPEKLRQIYHCYQTEDILKEQETRSTHQDKFIVYVGRLEKYKGIHTLLAAMRRCKNIHLKIVGDGSLNNELKQYVSKHQLHNVQFLGKKNNTDVLAVVKQAEFLVCPSECYEIFGFTIIEAMLMQTPVIGADIGAIPETVIPDQTGLLFEMGNEEQLAQQIITLFNQPEKIKQLGLNAEIYIREMVNPAKYYQSLKEIVQQL
nr:glycosyltransferase family 4 protein [Pseudopedobacter sp.]